MKQHVEQLYAISQKQVRRIIGLMSGTSLDGLDLAFCEIEGVGERTRLNVLHFITLPYEDAFKARVREVFSKKEIDFQRLVLLNVIVAEQHAAMINQCLEAWSIPASEVDLIASHGQTVFHAPRAFHHQPDLPNATLQIGDGDHIARRTGIVTVSDFRQKHIAAGGEGAPLALYGDYYLFSQPGETRLLLNIGGIANFSYLPGNGDSAAVFATDTGPGNTLLDAFARALFEVPYDEDARLAGNGRIDTLLLEILKKEPFFAQKLPKSTGPELFSADWVRAALAQLPKGHINPYDLMATLTALTVDTIAEAILSLNQLPGLDQALYLSGGGAHNPLIIKGLKEKLPHFRIGPMQALGLDGDAKEAVLFAILANENIAGAHSGTSLSGIPLMGMGKISFPG